MTAMDFPSVRYVYDALAARLGARIVVVPSDDGIGVSEDRLDRLTDDTAPSGSRPQPVAELALEPVLGGPHPEDLDVAEHPVGRQVGDAPVEVTVDAHVQPSPREPGREVVRAGLGAGRHEADAGGVGTFTGTWGVGVAPGPQPQPGGLEHRRHVFRRRCGRVSHDRLA